MKEGHSTQPADLTEAEADTAGPAEALPLEEALPCPECGYDLRGTSSDHCPECGLSIDPATLEQSHLPWTSRQRIGRVRAFCKTAWRVSLHPKQLAQEALRPVSYRDARRFQLAVVGLLLSTILVAAGVWLVAMLVVNEVPYPGFWWMLAIAGGVLVGTFLLAGFLLTATGVHTYWLHPRHVSITQQNRAVALGYYACAPLGLIPLFVVLGAVGAGLLALGFEARGLALQIIGGIVLAVSNGLTLVSLLAHWRNAVVVAKRVAQRGRRGLWFLGLALPACWMVLAWLWLLLVPMTVAWVGLMIFSLATM